MIRIFDFIEYTEEIFEGAKNTVGEKLDSRYFLCESQSLSMYVKKCRQKSVGENDFLCLLEMYYCRYRFELYNTDMNYLFSSSVSEIKKPFGKSVFCERILKKGDNFTKNKDCSVQNYTVRSID